MNSSLPRWLPVTLPFAIYVVHMLVFGTWIADDAGIYFAYARSFAGGDGLVSQPGMPPVEGFSGPLWILLLQPFFIAGWFDPVITPKAVGLVLGLATFLALQRIVSRWLVASQWAVLTVLTLLAMNSYFVIWTTSGLESPLYVCLLCLLLLAILTGISAGNGSARRAGFIGCLAGCVALARPDGVVYVVAFPLLLVATKLFGKQERLTKADAGYTVAYSVAFAALYGGYLLFRILYYGDIVPNVYHAKGGPMLSGVVAVLTLQPEMITKLSDLFASVGGVVGGLAAAALLLWTNVWLLVTRRFTRTHGVLTVFLVIASTIYLLMPTDWMGGYRFALPFYPFVIVYTVAMTTEFLRGPARVPRIRVAAAAGLAGWVLVWSGLEFTGFSRQFLREPVAPFARVTADARRFNQYAARLDIAGGSLALPDLGGSLYYSDLRVIDLAGLCDKAVAKTLRKRDGSFHDYVFDTVQPTFIHVAGPWLHITDFDSDARFRRDYVAIRELVGRSSPRAGPEKLWSGDYVRRDALAGCEEEFARLQAEAHEPPFVRLGGRRAKWGELRVR